MKRLLYFIILSAVACGAYAQADGNISLRQVTVTARRPMKEIGVQKTPFDSAMLKENVALSMADVLAFNSSVFVKSYGRATLSTVAFRGTSPSHTQVTWNGMRINNPMLGMTDFSTIPAYFIDQASLLHGTSSVNETGGGLGGLVRLGTLPDVPEGFNAQYVQGIGSFSTFDEFVRVTYGNDHWSSSTRAVYSSSPNDYEYTNHDKKVNIYDDDHNIVGQYHPKERNRSGSFKDFHILQEVYYNTLRGDRFGVNAWFVNSNRELPMLTTDYGKASDFENRQREHTFRGIISWDHNRSNWRTGVKGGYVHTWMGYDYKREVAPDNWAVMTRSRSKVNTIYGQIDGEYNPARRWYFTANVSAHQHFVRSEDKNIILQEGGNGIVGYDKGRIELSGAFSAKWQATDRIGMSLVLREEMFGEKWAPLTPAFFIDGLVARRGNVMLRASVSRNHKFPTLNDMYFLPGGNPDLRSEEGWTYDAGMSFDIGGESLESGSRAIALGGSVTWFDSYIDDWIIWLPTTKGFFSPRNVKKVHAYGIEVKGNMALRPAKGWLIDLNGSYSWTPSINEGEKMSPADMSVGKQLPYVPKHSASVTGRLSWQSWSFLYKWAYYSERFTMSSNDYTLTGHLPDYFMSNVSLEKGLSFKPLDMQLKLAVNNLFNEDYMSVLSRPMPGINFEFFIGITPKFRKKK
ncbi:TonB-dependent receptor [Duncaniella freteri]|uniref:TonB-dependent receptor n=1 Tax=Duncaniella freteri TaxID=2530391 RepID=UPI00137223D5|nr:TonB-dependent receptor [Duncaniella freteri]NBJ06564.1 TonB-dependent receptor [Alistipes sp. Z76]NCE68657.1 TonB-dependent receptor [Muribaculaceae bacterium M3]